MNKYDYITTDFKLPDEVTNMHGLHIEYKGNCKCIEGSSTLLDKVEEIFKSKPMLYNRWRK